MTHALKIIEVLGILAFAMSGILEARKKGLDVVGIYFVAMITAFGGGTVRDILLNHYPLFWIQHAEYPVVVLVLCLISYLGIARLFDHARGIWLVVIFDALGLAGGFQDFANTKKITIIRGGDRLYFNYNDYVKGKKEALDQNIWLQNGDTIYVK